MESKLFYTFVQKAEQMFSVFKKSKIYKYLDGKVLELRFGESWAHDGSDHSFSRRMYHSYEDYRRHQSSKLNRIDPIELSEYDIKYREVLIERLKKIEISHKGLSVLCLGARIGTEVKSFIDIGCFAVGIDLNPGENNRYTVYGDFHNIQFADSSVDIVFTNSLDHAFDIGKVMNEVTRVLKPGGLFIVEAIKGSEEDVLPDFYASFWWGRIDYLVCLIENSQFKLTRRVLFDTPWSGEQLCFVRKN
jgi:SAM-dependent methyltransferase